MGLAGNSWETWKNHHNIISGRTEWVRGQGGEGGVEHSLKSNILFWFLSKFFYVHLYKTSIYLKSLCWMEFLPKCNSWGVEIRMSWLEKIWKINQRWGGTSIRHQRVHTYFHLLLWEDPLIFLSLSVWNYCDGLSSWTM